MVRPNIDIDNYLAGGVRDIEDWGNMTRTEAYALVLRMGLKELDHPGFECVQPPESLTTPQTGQSDTDTLRDDEDTTDTTG